MKVKMESGYRELYTVADVERAKAVIAAEKADEETAAGYAEYAVREALRDTGDYAREIVKAEAHTAKNYRAWDAYDTNTGNMDILVDAIAETAQGFIKVSAYLTDIWQTGAVEYRQHEYIRRYTAEE